MLERKRKIKGFRPPSKHQFYKAGINGLQDFMDAESLNYWLSYTSLRENVAFFFQRMHQILNATVCCAVCCVDKYINNLTCRVLFGPANAIKGMEYVKEPNISALLCCIGEDDRCQLNWNQWSWVKQMMALIKALLSEALNLFPNCNACFLQSCLKLSLCLSCFLFREGLERAFGIYFLIGSIHAYLVLSGWDS